MTTNPVNIAPAIQPETSVFAECTQKIRDLIAKIQAVIMGILETILPCIFGKTVVEPPKNTISTGENLPQAQAVQNIQQAVLPKPPAPQPVAPAPAPIARPAPAAQPAAPAAQPRPPAAQPAPALQPVVAQPAQQPVVPVEVPAAQPAAPNPEPALPPVQQDVQPAAANVQPPANPVEQREAEVSVLNIAPPGIAAPQPAPAVEAPLGVREAAKRFAGGPAPQPLKTNVVGKFGQAAGASPQEARPSTPAPGPQPAPAPKQAIPPAQLKPVEADGSEEDDFEQLDIPNPGTLKIPLLLKTEGDNPRVLPPKPGHQKSKESEVLDDLTKQYEELGIKLDETEVLAGDSDAKHLMQVAALKSPKSPSDESKENKDDLLGQMLGMSPYNPRNSSLISGASPNSVLRQVLDTLPVSPTTVKDLPKGTVVSGKNFLNPGAEPLLVLDPEPIWDKLAGNQAIQTTQLDNLIAEAKERVDFWQSLRKDDYKSLIISILEPSRIFEIIGTKNFRKNKTFNAGSIQEICNGLKGLQGTQNVIGAVFCKGTIQNPKVYGIFYTQKGDWYLLDPYKARGQLCCIPFNKDSKALGDYLLNVDSGSVAQAEEICWVTPFFRRKAAAVDPTGEKWN